MSEPKKEPTRAKTRLKMKAVRKESTRKPGTRLEAKSTRRVLMTRINKPKVTMVMGRVRKTRMGLTMAFKMPKTTATTKAVK